VSAPVLRPAPDFARPVIGELLRFHAEHRPHKRFLACGPVSYTYRELDERSDRVAAGFARLGIARGDRVAVLCPNRYEVFELFFGLAKLGAVQVPLNAFLKGEFLRHQVADSGAVALVADAAGADAVAPLLPDLTDLRLLVLLEGARPTGTSVPYAELRQEAGPPPDVDVRPSDLMSILYTSGTTGLPKGCMLPHGYYVRVGELMATSMEQCEQDILFTALPAFHAITRMMVTVAALTRGSGVVIEEGFHASTFMARAAEVGATLAYGVGTTGVALLATPRSELDRAHSLRTFMIGPFTPGQQDEFAERFGADVWVEIFGQTECVGITWSPVAGPRNRASVGRQSPDLEVTVLDDEGHPVADGEVGEICLRPRHRFAMFAGYWRNPQATVTATTGLWYHTGDYGKRDVDGFYMFVDRKKDAIRRRGENISSFELEMAVLRHESIADVAIHGVPSGSTEDIVMAVIVPVPGHELNPAEFFAFLRGTLPYFAVPRYVRIVEEIPRNATLRVMKFKLRELPIDDSVWDFEKMGLVIAADARR
jgi:crotonobetaine/carnitine-CoA ligase